MAKSKWNSPWPRANSNGTSVRPSAVAPPTRKPARVSPGQENSRRDGASRSRESIALSVSQSSPWPNGNHVQIIAATDLTPVILPFFEGPPVDSGVQISAVDLEETGYTTSARNLPRQ